MKKIISVLLASAVLLTSCGNSNPDTVEESSPNQVESSASQAESTPVENETSEAAFETTHQSATSFVNSIGTVWVQIIVEVENTGTSNLFLKTGSYDLEDASGKLVQSGTMLSAYPNVIAPGEKGYYYEETTLDGTDGAIELNLLPRVKPVLATVEQISLPTSDVEIVNDKYGRIEAKGRVENNSSESQKLVYVAIILFDANDKPIGLMFIIVMEEMAIGDKIGFSASSMSMPTEVSLDAVARFEVVAYPFQMQF